ncbi:hypothetical protein RAAC3_TM7C00001G0671 [Candidatus Saccharibacteria bacterium RAAC3_TM7_1]|nr:hypothetical protein RAAC3_TM7C00001G0671 [Candidatus Saccharibacteria bacterium RAAC3_TM7_1]HCZ28613.1 hypothetical protein [Candidatus Saccharibacteria bacterium]
MTREIKKPILITFDGEARTGKGTIVQATKDFLRDELGYKVMLIDRGQTFRVLVVAATRAGANLDDPTAIDAFLEDKQNVAACVQFVKDVYHMEKSERDNLLYTNQVGESSAKVGARPASQKFVANLTKKWLHDAGIEDFEVVLVDGRALENIAQEMEAEGLCDYRAGLYFICEEYIGARRTLGYAATKYEDLSPSQRVEVEDLVAQIKARNQRDFERDVEPLIRPNAPTIVLPSAIDPEIIQQPSGRYVAIIDTSADMTKRVMCAPVLKLMRAVFS